MPFSLKRKNKKVTIVLLQNYKSPGHTPESSISWERKPVEGGKEEGGSAFVSSEELSLFGRRREDC